MTGTAITRREIDMKINNLDEFLKREEFKGAFPDIMSDWKSPVEIMMGEMETKLENDTMTAIQRYNICVDKDELVKALNYDRDQFKKGYISGKTEKQSRWVLDDITGILDCEKCGRQAPIDITSGEFAHSPFCPWCGSFMLGGDT